MGSRNGAGSVSLAYSAGTAVPGDEHLASGARFLQFLLQAAEGVMEGLRLASPIFELMNKALH